MKRAQVNKALRSFRWLPAYGWQRIVRRAPSISQPLHLIIALADHFEPSIVPENPSTFAELTEQERRLERWCSEYPKAVEAWPDSDGRSFRHTYFFPAEQAHAPLIKLLAEHCREGWGEAEIHLHHGIERPDTAENTRRVIKEFRDVLAAHGCLSLWDGKGEPRYAFVHGNWALANSAGGRFCGVDDEMRVLAETGCYADFTLPSAPHPAQIGKINSLYECALPLETRAPHRRGRELRAGQAPQTFPLIIQGPLSLDFARNGSRHLPRIENGELAARRPPTLRRLELWKQSAIKVHGRPDWLFIKLHCHGMDPRDEAAMTGELMQKFLCELSEDVRANNSTRVHFVTAREMTNIILAACDGREGNPADYFDYRLRLVSTAKGA